MKTLFSASDSTNETNILLTPRMNSEDIALLLLRVSWANPYISDDALFIKIIRESVETYSIVRPAPAETHKHAQFDTT